METSKIKKVSVVMPIYNEEGNIRDLHAELKEVLDGQSMDHEIIFVDDCSYDDSFKVLSDIFKKDSSTKVISLMGNQGKAVALNVALKQATGDVVVVMDGDGQHDPKYIPQFIAAIEDGYDMASGWKDKDSGRHKLKSFVHDKVNRTLSRIMGVKLRYFGIAMKAYRRELIQNLELWGDLHRFVGALVHYKGIRIKEIPISIRARGKGVSNYSFRKIAWKIFLDIILVKFLIKYARTPFRIFGTLGILSIFCGVLGASYLAYHKYVLGINVFYNSAALIVSALFFIMGLQFIFFGLMAELISRAYYTSEKRQRDIIRAELKHRP